MRLENSLFKTYKNSDKLYLVDLDLNVAGWTFDNPTYDKIAFIYQDYARKHRQNLRYLKYIDGVHVQIVKRGEKDFSSRCEYIQ